MDVDPSSAEKVGRAAMAQVGYLPIMRLARQVGWLTIEKIERVSSSNPALLAMGGAGGFIEVFSKYAVVAGVASQADSPVPGPGDALAVGIVVIGLIDAGLLAGALLDSIEDAASPAPSATTAAPPAVPTVTVPPVATTAPIAKESDVQRQERCKKVKNQCIEECTHLLGQGYRPPQTGKRGRGQAGGGTNTQFDFDKCVRECVHGHGC